ncbi:DUF1972 domain-containing protein [Paracandidimonas soli]|uniref:Glycosyltransferase involved in cell wall biosynthesis n=1 Tax=Paracandidimonas soli TaxID=1917182 RepID=A0A4V2VRG2_9BURK|nr:DUF1972 domain-containing protein [Paracandidimonas soli]TCU98309.1 glycosyltransferase involved in cell wall biosynthesis [Paracandidimonas soli]
MKDKRIFILGTRGVPAQHGGFETFAERLSLYLHDAGWSVAVYCQEEGKGDLFETNWRGVRRIHIPVNNSGALGTIIFDLKSICHAAKENGLFLTLGYNTAIFNCVQYFKGQFNIINMDGIEWRRDKWGLMAKIWFWLNERAGCWVGNHLVADHPKIKEHLATRVRKSKITMIPYGGDEVLEADAQVLSAYNLKPNEFSIVIARPEPENSFLEMVRSFSRKNRSHKLVVLGSFRPHENDFHKAVMNAASEEVLFPGAIYDAKIVRALRFFARFYLHGHRVGGTNPSLVEALGAGCAVIAHANHFNKWVAGDGAAYFSDEIACEKLFDTLLYDEKRQAQMKEASRKRFHENFTWEKILKEYEQLFLSLYPN